MTQSEKLKQAESKNASIIASIKKHESGIESFKRQIILRQNKFKLQREQRASAAENVKTVNEAIQKINKRLRLNNNPSNKARCPCQTLS